MAIPGLMPTISRLATRAYYRFTIGGGRVPADGPVLLVANHNNGLLDAAFVTVAARREVRFLAKAPLLAHPYIGWLVRAVGSLPVYRVQDDPRRVGENRDIFVAVHDALAEGAAVGIFPEGTSHSGSRLSPIKTGAARIALGAAGRIGRDFPIIPVGLVFRDRNSLRSEARVVVGDAFDWSDLAARCGEKYAIRELTRRIDGAMRLVTLNLDAGEDAALVHMAEQIWAAEHGSARDATSTVSRLALTANVLHRFRLRGDAEWQQTARELHAHALMLRRMGLTPQALKEDVSWLAAVRWALARLPLLIAVPLAWLAILAYWPAIATSRWLSHHNPDGPDSESTYLVLGVAILGALWTVLVSGAVGWVFGRGWGLSALVLLPSAAVVAAMVAERRRLGWLAVRRFFVRHLHRRRLGRMRTRQAAIAKQLNGLLELGMR